MTLWSTGIHELFQTVHCSTPVLGFEVWKKTRKVARSELNVIGCPENEGSVHVMLHSLWRMQHLESLEIVAPHFVLAE